MDEVRTSTGTRADDVRSSAGTISDAFLGDSLTEYNVDDAKASSLLRRILWDGQEKWSDHCCLSLGLNSFPLPAAPSLTADTGATSLHINWDEAAPHKAASNQSFDHHE